MYVYELSKKDIDLSKSEVLSLILNDEFELIDNYLIVNELIDSDILAYSKKAYELLFLSSKNSFLNDFKKFDFNSKYKCSFKLDLVNNKDFDVKILADIIWNNIKNPVCDLKQAKSNFHVIFAKKIICGLLLWENKDSFEKRRAHLRPSNHPTSLHPRLARCLINLADSDCVLDPFCGSGGLLIEAGLRGLDITGFDIDKIMLKRCEQNLKYYKITNYNLQLQDALKNKKKFKAIVTDLPYGKNSKASDLESLFSDFLLKYFSLVDRMVVVFPDFINANFLIDQSGWKIKNHFSYYLHKSLTKKIFVLEK